MIQWLLLCLCCHQNVNLNQRSFFRPHYSCSLLDNSLNTMSDTFRSSVNTPGHTVSPKKITTENERGCLQTLGRGAADKLQLSPQVALQWAVHTYVSCAVGETNCLTFSCLSLPAELFLSSAAAVVNNSHSLQLIMAAGKTFWGK